MRLSPKCFPALTVCALLAGQARAGSTTLTFEGLKNFEGVADYYNNGKGTMGTGPGPAYGITFSQNAAAYIPGQQNGKVIPYPGDPSPPTVFLLAAPGNAIGAGQPITATMDVKGGFVGALTYYYINITDNKNPATVQIFSGLDGGGKLLATQNLLMVQPGREVFSGETRLSFKGIARSVVFSGGNDQVAVDNISLKPASPAPEPSTIVLVVVSLPFVLAARRLQNPSRG
jgi:hypothetical protein